MSGIKGKDTKPEKLVRRFLHRAGFRFRLHDPRLPGRPDIVLRKYKAVVQVHGCFWHRHEGCGLAYSPKSREDFWAEKFAGNTKRDRNNRNQLLEAGWRVMVVWECGLRNSELRDQGLNEIAEWIRSDWTEGEFPRRPSFTT